MTFKKCDFDPFFPTVPTIDEPSAYNKFSIPSQEMMLKNLESKVIEQDIHWRSVVQAKDKELNLLKSAGALQ